MGTGAESERVFLQEGNVSVSDKRFVVGAQTYPLSGITSIKSHQQVPSRVIPIVIGLFGLLVLASSVAGGAIAILVAFLIWFLQKPAYSVVLSTAAGEQQALMAPDRAYIERVVQALNNAVVARR
jgi:hypothetical protein